MTTNTESECTSCASIEQHIRANKDTINASTAFICAQPKESAETSAQLSILSGTECYDPILCCLTLLKRQSDTVEDQEEASRVRQTNISSQDAATDTAQEHTRLHEACDAMRQIICVFPDSMEDIIIYFKILPLDEDSTEPSDDRIRALCNLGIWGLLVKCADFTLSNARLSAGGATESLSDCMAGLGGIMEMRTTLAWAVHERMSGIPTHVDEIKCGAQVQNVVSRLRSHTGPHRHYETFQRQPTERQDRFNTIPRSYGRREDPRGRGSCWTEAFQK